MKKSSTESSAYSKLGASSAKGAVHTAIGKTHRSYFAELNEDVTGNPAYLSLLHADGAGTKSILAYIAYKETGDPTWFKSLAYDSLVMNLDDIACVNAFESLTLSNTIGRNKNTIPDAALKEIISGYKEVAEHLSQNGIDIKLCGGESADLGDLIRTVVIDSTLFARVKKSEVISTDNIKANDIIIGLSSTGKAKYESESNSGLGSNGYTLARHALVASKYAEKYPEILDPAIKAAAYQGKLDLFEEQKNLDTSLIKALLSPTRSYSPVIRKITKELKDIHGIIHCTGGGQTKIIGFGKNKKYIKDDLFPIPEIFRMIQESMRVPLEEMYSVFNMGHRMEIICDEKHLKTISEISNEFGIEAKQIGYVEDSGSNCVVIKSAGQEFIYG